MFHRSVPDRAGFKHVQHVLLHRGAHQTRGAHHLKKKFFLIGLTVDKGKRGKFSLVEN